MNVWLIIINPYAYDEAMEDAIEMAKISSCDLNVVFLIDHKSLNKTLNNIGEHRLFGLGAIHNLQSSLSLGYHKLGENVLQRVERKAQDVHLKIQGIVEGVILKDYLESLISEGVIKIFVATTSSSSLNGINEFSDKVQIIQE